MALGGFLYDHFSVLIPPNHPLSIYVDDRKYKVYQADLAYLFERLLTKLYEQKVSLVDVQNAACMKLREESWIYAMMDTKELTEKNEFTATIPDTIQDLTPNAYEYVCAIKEFVVDYGILRDAMPKCIVDSYMVSLWIGLNLRAIAGLETTSEVPLVSVLVS